MNLLTDVGLKRPEPYYWPTIQARRKHRLMWFSARVKLPVW